MDVMKAMMVAAGLMVVYGNHGQIVVDKTSGLVLERSGCHEGPDGGPCGECTGYSEIVRVDVAEALAWEHENFPASQHGDMWDILLVGYWTKDGLYVPPEALPREMSVKDYKSIIAPAEMYSMFQGVQP